VSLIPSLSIPIHHSITMFILQCINPLAMISTPTLTWLQNVIDPYSSLLFGEILFFFYIFIIFMLLLVENFQIIFLFFFAFQWNVRTRILFPAVIFEWLLEFFHQIDSSSTWWCREYKKKFQRGLFFFLDDSLIVDWNKWVGYPQKSSNQWCLTRMKPASFQFDKK
jgi:hypothetical protein